MKKATVLGAALGLAGCVVSACSMIAINEASRYGNRDGDVAARERLEAQLRPEFPGAQLHVVALESQRRYTVTVRDAEKTGLGVEEVVERLSAADVGDWTLETSVQYAGPRGEKVVVFALDAERAGQAWWLATHLPVLADAPPTVTVRDQDMQVSWSAAEADIARRRQALDAALADAPFSAAVSLLGAAD